jgi:hypothetical protein
MSSDPLPPLPWKYRPDPYDDFGFVRDVTGNIVANTCPTWLASDFNDNTKFGTEEWHAGPPQARRVAELLIQAAGEADSAMITHRFAWSLAALAGNNETYEWWTLGDISCGCMVTTIRLLCDCREPSDPPDDPDIYSWMLEMATHEPDEEPEWRTGFGLHVQTIGQLRTLARGLGVPLVERQGGVSDDG